MKKGLREQIMDKISKIGGGFRALKSHLQGLPLIFRQGRPKRRMGVLALSVATLIIFGLSLTPKQTEAAWWNETWLYRKRVDITNTSGGNVTDFQVMITLDTAALISGGKLQSDCDDLRVTDANGKLLSYWFSGCNTSTTKIWPRVPLVSTAGTYVYVYYGNLSAVSGKTKIGTAEYPGLSCKSILDAGDSSGIGNYTIDPSNGNFSDAFSAYCDMTNDSGGWMLVKSTMINGQTNTATATTPTADVNGGLILSTGITTPPTSCGGQHNYQVLFSDIIPWTQIKADYEFTGAASCWSVLGNNSYGVGANLIPFASGTDTIRNQVRMGGATGGDNYDGINTRCDNETVNFWHSNNGTSARSAQVILRRNSMGSLAGLGTGTNCNSTTTDWKYQNIFIRESSMASSTITVGTPTTEEKSPAPIGYWKFDEGTGTTANDSSGQNKTGTFLSSPVWKTEDMCVSGKCLAFDNVDDGVSIANENYTSLTDYTMCAWVNPKGNHKNYTGTILSSGDWNVNHWAFGINQTNTIIQTRRADGTNSPSWNYTFSLSKWTHVCLTRLGTTITAYANGNRVGSPYTGTTGNLVSNATNTTIGRETYAGGYFDFNGSIDETKIYPYARTALQIKNDYNARGSSGTEGSSVVLGSNDNNLSTLTDGLVGYWKMDENTGTTVVDSSGNSGTLTFGGNAPTWVTGKFGSAIQYNGSNSIATVPNSTAINITGNSTTLSAWVYLTAFPASYGVIYQKNGYADGYRLMINSTGKIYSDMKATERAITSTNSISLNTWTLINVTYDGSQMVTYINSTSAGAASVTPGNLTGNTASISFGQTEYPPITGNIDEARIYNLALSPDKIRDLYNFVPGPVGYWKLDENTSSSAYDTSGSNNTGTLLNSPVWTVGKYGSALNFNDSSKRVTIANPLSLSGYSTVSLWHRRSESDASSSWRTLVGHASANIHHLIINNSSRNLGIFDGSWRDFGYNVPNDGLWHHFEVVYNSGSTATLYVDGVYKNQIAMTLDLSANPIGSFGNWGSNSYWAGPIDDIKIYNYARSAKQIVEDMNAGHPAGGSPVGSQIGYWKFDEGNGTILHNSGFGGSNGVIVGTNWNNNGRFGKALYFNGTLSDYVAITQSDNVMTSASDSFSLSAWVNLESDTGSLDFIIGKIGWHGGLLTDGSSTIRFTLNNSLNEYYSVVYNNPNLSQWYYVVGVFNRPDNSMKLYIDGKLIGTTTFVGDIRNYDNVWRIGGYGNASYNFKGLIDEVKIYNSALTEDEIKVDYNQGAAIVFGNNVGDVSDNPMGYWKLDENTGTTVNNFGTCVNCNGTSAAITYSSGKINGAYDMQPSVSNYWYVPANATLDVDAKFTVEAWGTYDAASRYGLFANNTVENQFNAWVNGTSVAILGTTLSGGTVQAGQWFHTAVTYDGTSYRLYVNGTLVSTDSSTGARDFSGCWVFGQEVDGVGLCSSGFDASQAWDGKIDEVKIYNYVRSASQIKADAATDKINPSLSGSPVGEWMFDEGVGTIVNDTSGNGNTGTWLGAANKEWGVGKVGNAGKFRGANNDYVDVGSNSILRIPGDSTYEAWVKLTATVFPDPTTNWVIFDNESYLNYGTIFRIDGASKRLYLRTNQAGVHTSAMNTTVLNNNTWYHLVAVKSSGNIIFYVNGGSDGGGAITNPVTSSTSMKIGNNGQSLNGLIDQVKIYDYARTPAQIAYDYNKGAPVGWWKLDECEGGVAHDASGFGNDGTITVGGSGTQTSVGTCTTASTAWGNGAVGKDNASVNFDGTDDYVDIPDQSRLRTTTESFSVWFKSSVLPPITFGGVISHSNSTDGYNILQINTGKIRAYRRISGNWRYVESVVSVTDGNWHHAVAIYDGTTILFYIDGVLQGTDSDVAVTIFANTNYKLGVYSTDRFFTGQIDDIRIYNYALTAQQVNDIYNLGAVNFR